jgi:hypothetical protein
VWTTDLERNDPSDLTVLHGRLLHMVYLGTIKKLRVGLHTRVSGFYSFSLLEVLAYLTPPPSPRRGPETFYSVNQVKAADVDDWSVLSGVSNHFMSRGF